MVGQQPLSNDPQQPQYPTRDPTPRIPSSSKPPPIQTKSSSLAQYGLQQQAIHQPQTTYSNPQELATTSPTGHGPASTYSASLYSQEDSYSAAVPPNSQLPSQQQYTAYVPQTQAQHISYEPSAPLDQQPAPPQQAQKYTAYAMPQQPSYEPPTPPTGRMPSPIQLKAGYTAVVPKNARNTLPSQGQYKPYQQSGSTGQTGGQAGGGPPAAPGEPADFYRSAAY